MKDRTELLTELGRALGTPGRRLDPPRVHFRCDQAKLEAERDAASIVITNAIERYQFRCSRIARERSARRRAARTTA